MKKILLTLLLLITCFVNTFAYDACVDGIYYNLVSMIKQATVTSGDTKYTGSVVIPETVTYDGVEYSVTSIGDYAFNACTGLTSVTIPNSVTKIGEDAFRICTNLASVIIPNSVTSIGNSAFYYCTGLSSVEIPESVTSIGDRAFYYCTGLTSINIPNSVTSIGDRAFNVCKSVLFVTIGNSVTSIGNLAFTNCTSITSITCKAITPPDCKVAALKNISTTIPVYVPKESVEAYKAADVWKDLKIQAIIPAVILGDANNDGVVNVGDLSSIVGYILNTNVIDGFNESAADANQDNSIDVGDLSTIVKMILGINNSDVKSRIVPKTTADNQATMNAKSLEMKPGEDALMYVNLDNSMDVASFQFDIQLPEGFTCENVTADYRRVEENASLNYAKMNENSIRVLCYSPSNETINGTNGNIAIIKIHADNDLQVGNYEATMSGIKVANADECKGVEDFKFDISVGSATGIQGVMSDNNDNTTKYDMSGRAVNKNAQGIIISNGKKYMKK